ncbi:hypothetical protein K445DRAFT_300172 [Daldinia sp. EC12]|nr:hypothetical protein K445DRAFT_300172 [Daldinia sp. EC12]
MAFNSRRESEEDVKPKLESSGDEHPVIQSVTRERNRHNAEIRRVKIQLAELEAEQDKLWVDNEQLRELLDHLPDQTSMDEYVSRIDDLQNNNDHLQEEIWRLKGMSAEEVNELRDEVLPTHARNSITPEQLTIEYRNYIDGIMNLIYAWVKPLLDNEKFARKVVDVARQDGSGAELLRWLEAYPDIARLSSFHVSTEYVLLAVIIRWVDQHVFSTSLGGMSPELVEMLDNIENSLYNNVSPRHRVVEIRRWRQTTYCALTQHPEYKQARIIHEENLAVELRKILLFLPTVRDDAHALQRLQSTVVFPALELNELFLTSTDYFHLQSWDFLPGGGVPSGTTTTPEQLYEYREWIELEDPLDNSSKVSLQDKSADETTRRLDPVCTVVPAVILTTADDYEEVVLCCQAYIIAAWGLPQARSRKWNEQTAGFLNGFLEGPAL